MTFRRILNTEFKQREYDGKWEKIIQVLDHDNTYHYTNEKGTRAKFIPTHWLTVGVYDMVGEISV